MFEDVELYLTDLKSKFDKIKPNTYYLSYSGGKDSHFLYWFIKEYLKRDDIKIVGINTYMEHHEILKRILKNCDIVLYPKMKPMEIKAKYGIPCFSKMQDDIIDRYQRGSRAKSTMERIYGADSSGRDWTKYKLNKTAKTKLLDGTLHKVSPKCCKMLKKEPAREFEKETGLKPILGVRSSESALRKSKYHSCFTKDGKFTPIHDLSDELLDKIYKQYNIEIPEVYNHICRTGCMGCPYGSYKHDTEKELDLILPQQRKFVEEYFKESYEVLGIDLVEKVKE
jgi:3'-phosphoadenosine 5'-phosphosulfate sulfotransferase (PAPS reductase)/FAD synthetase